ncbi:hypothetical protein BBK36DRAFT_1168136 [Trichoderma citrinoviride]|uniref:PA14 domain-containing protein n=1 Tax=Trichoderma citrinoviride TaxID=58853 RepID=A0A2T4BET8_9HYPO|nr:hypothetical protein BBK36DRAFT_1168136 [Trichoderma citrinoviride]PTB67761.1 hypothetical protein BBK36DRAFT_1168136 [Trichoderma citrinoviride]
MTQMFSSLAVLALALSSAIVASPAPQLVSGIVDPATCLAVDIIVGLLVGDPLAVAYCAVVTIRHPKIQEPPRLLKPTAITVTSANSNSAVPPTITSSATTTTTISSCTASPTPFRRHFFPGEAPIPALVTRYQTPNITKGCSCLSLPTPTVTSVKAVTISPTITITRTTDIPGAGSPVVATSTVTHTSTTTACPALATCGNQGVEFAYYNRTAGGDLDDSQPEVYKMTSTAPLSSRNSDFILNHRDYIYARMTGACTFALNQVDDAAYAGWTGANVDAGVVYDNGPAQGTFTADLAEGEYYPFRIIYGQGPRIGEFDIRVTSPDGTTFLSSGTTGSPYLVRFSCDGSTAPPFSSFGLEP